MLSEDGIRRLLDEVARGALSIEEALGRLRRLPFEQIDDASIDHHRRLRDGLGEVVYCEGKTPRQVADIVQRLAAASDRVLGTRADPQHFEAARAVVPQLQYHEAARAIWLDGRRSPAAGQEGVVVVCAGTSDLNVAEEAILTMRMMDQAPLRIADVGVAGVHRLLNHLEALQAADVIVAVAGMEGALPSVVAGLVDAPVIAVPTSVGYGVGLQGLTALFGMLSSCAAGVAVVNIDNGFGAGYLAGCINRRIRAQK